MEVEFDDDDLKRILYDADYRPRYPEEVIKKYRERMQFILRAHDERDFRAMKSFHFEELKGKRKGQNSVRLNKKYRLVFRIEGVKDGKKIVIQSIEDYH